MAVSTASNLAEERPDIGELVMTPMLEKPLSVGRDFPIVGVGEPAPLVNVVPKLIDDCRSRVVLLLLGGEALAFVENNLLLLGGGLLLPRLRNGRDELGLATAFDDSLRRLAVLIQLPVLSWVFIG